MLEFGGRERLAAASLSLLGTVVLTGCSNEAAQSDRYYNLTCEAPSYSNKKFFDLEKGGEVAVFTIVGGKVVGLELELAGKNDSKYVEAEHIVDGTEEGVTKIKGLTDKDITIKSGSEENKFTVNVDSQLAPGKKVKVELNC